MSIKLKVSCGYVNCDWEEDVSDWVTLEDVEKSNKCEMPKQFEDEVLTAAIEMSGFEYYFEVEDEEEDD